MPRKFIMRRGVFFFSEGGGGVEGGAAPTRPPPQLQLGPSRQTDGAGERARKPLSPSSHSALMRSQLTRNGGGKKKAFLQ